MSSRCTPTGRELEVMRKRSGLTLCREFKCKTCSNLIYVPLTSVSKGPGYTWRLEDPCSQEQRDTHKTHDDSVRDLTPLPDPRLPTHDSRPHFPNPNDADPLSQPTIATTTSVPDPLSRLPTIWHFCCFAGLPRRE